jgi:hypothetical protein
LNERAVSTRLSQAPLYFWVVYTKGEAAPLDLTQNSIPAQSVREVLKDHVNGDYGLL